MSTSNISWGQTCFRIQNFSDFRNKVHNTVYYETPHWSIRQHLIKYMIVFVAKCNNSHTKQNFLKKHCNYLYFRLDFLGGSDGKVSAYNDGDPGSILRSGRSPAEGNGNPLQYSCLENPMDGGTW